MVEQELVADTDNPLSYEPLELSDDPYPLYSRLRDEAPVYAGRSEAGRFWALSRFDDVQAAARNWGAFSSAEGNDLDDTGLLFAPAGELSSADPPVHTRLRDAVRKEFSPKPLCERLEPLVEDKVGQLIADLLERETADFARELAYPLPAAMVCGWLGFPASDHDLLTSWHSALLERKPGQVELPPSALGARDEMRAYIAEAMIDRREHGRDDLLSVLVNAQAAGTLSQDEVLGAALLLFDAGISTTSALISSSLLHLQRFEGQRELLRRSPGIMPAAVEELLRFDAPFQWFTRVTTHEVEIHDLALPAGGRVVLIWASANRDDRRWDAPDELVLTRDPQRHVSFGEGIHHCLGAPLARLEARILFERLMPLLDDYEITGPVERRIIPSERTIVSLPVTVQWDRRRV
jgi:cytochrome P450